MNILPHVSGTRPRLACEILPQGVVAGRSSDTNGALEAVSHVVLTRGAVAPGLKPGNLPDRVAVVTAIRDVLQQIGERPNAREGNLTLIVPDAAVRVLLLEFEALPSRISEALPLVRFRLKKLLPFDADEAMVSYQTMSSGKAGVRVLAVAIPRDVLSEYETAVREAGYEPGAVLPSTLACLAALPTADPVLLVNASPLGVTAAIVRAGIVMLHRSVDLQGHAPHDDLSPAGDGYGAANAVAHTAPSEAGVEEKSTVGSLSAFSLEPTSIENEIAQSVSVAAAYFEDTLAAPPTEVLSAGPLGAERLSEILNSLGVEYEGGWKVRELAENAVLLPGAASSSVPRSYVAGVLGAVRS
ncbi:MAG: hypothetical protein ACP5E5_07940 [Acidobacteriaceae bacterium]